MANDVTGWNQVEPDHMDRWHRNERLYAWLRDRGLWVECVYSKDDCPRLEYIKVAVATPNSD